MRADKISIEEDLNDCFSNPHIYLLLDVIHTGPNSSSYLPRYGKLGATAATFHVERLNGLGGSNNRKAFSSSKWLHDFRHAFEKVCGSRSLIALFDSFSDRNCRFLSAAKMRVEITSTVFLPLLYLWGSELWQGSLPFRNVR